MWNISECLLRDAESVADMMLESGEEIRPIPFGSLSDSIFLTTSPELVVASHTFKRREKVFFIGWKRLNK